MADPNDSDSSWGDSTLDFTSPRQMGPDQAPKINIDIEDEEASQLDSVAEKPKPKERVTVPANQQTSPSTELETDSPVKKDSKATFQIFTTDTKTRQGRPVEESPPYNFRPALSGDITPQRDTQRPGKDRKGTTYDTPERASRPRSASFQSNNSWDDSEEEQKTLQELRRNFSMEKLKEQQAEELRLKLKNQELEALERHEDGQATNRSETTWKSWASFGTKLGRSSNRSNKGKNPRKKEGVPVATRTEEIPVQASVQAMSRQQQQQRPNPTNIFQTEPNPPPDNGLPGYPLHKDPDIGLEEKQRGFSETPAMMSAPYIVKDEEGGVTYYFGHGPLQYYEVDDDADEAMLPHLADRLEVLFQRIWQEVFGALRIVTSFFVLLIVELLKYVFKSIVQPILIGVFQSLGEFVIKPLLSLIFNGFVQPTSIFLWNCFMTCKHMFGPIGEILGKVFVKLAMLCRSIRLVEINWKTNHPAPDLNYNADAAKNV